jgi:hypothetical protein
MKAPLLACALAIAPIAAQAQTLTNPIGPTILPPEEYDKPYPGKLILVRGDAEYMRAVCPTTSYLVTPGCSYRLAGGASGACLVVIADEETLKVAQHRIGGHTWTYDIIFRHEVGHCNGWSANHEGARAAWPARPDVSAAQPVVPEQRGAPLRGQWPSDLKRKADDLRRRAEAGDEEAAREIGMAVAAGAKACIENPSCYRRQ